MNRLDHRKKPRRSGRGALPLVSDLMKLVSAVTVLIQLIIRMLHSG